MNSSDEPSLRESPRVEVVFIHGEPGGGPCNSCGRMAETRFGCCFDCASEGERQAAYHTVWQHLARVPWRIWHRDWFGAKTRLSWAWERLTQTGDYAPGGEFDSQYFNPRPRDVLIQPSARKDGSSLNTSEPS